MGHPLSQHYGTGDNAVEITDELEGLLAWKLTLLQRAGFAPEEALAVVGSEDWRLALRTVAVGGTPAQAIAAVA